MIQRKVAELHFRWRERKLEHERQPKPPQDNNSLLGTLSRQRRQLTHDVRDRHPDRHSPEDTQKHTGPGRQTQMDAETQTSTERHRQTNADKRRKPDKHEDEQHTNKKSVIAVFVSLHPTPSHLKAFKISDLSSSHLEALTRL